MEKKDWCFLLPIIIFAFFAWFSFWKLLFPPYLTFSDSAKFADIARNIAVSRSFGANFAPFQKEFLEIRGLFPIGIPPLFPFLVAIGFKLFGIYDWAVPLISGIFYLLSAVALFYLGKKIFNELVGFLAALAFIFDPAMLGYATSGASESLFIFELIFACFMLLLRKRWSMILGFVTLLAMYWTRQSAIIYMAGFVFFFVFLKFKSVKEIVKVATLSFFIYFLIEVILTKFSKGLFLYSPLAIFFYGAAKFSPIYASTETLRGGMATVGFQLNPFLTKLFYNLYNFYKLLPQALSPYLAGFYILSLFRWEDTREKKIFRGLVLFFVLATFFAAAATLPIYRYLHPVAPFVYLLAVEMLVWIVAKIIPEKAESFKTLSTTLFLVFIFIIGQTLGKIFLDSRYIQARTNQGKPPVYVQLSKLLKESTRPDDLVITNLDAWGSWYGQRRTIWFPLEPRQLVPEPGKELKINAIYLTSYKMDDENYYMGENWRQAFENPTLVQDEFLAKNFVFGGKFEIKPEETYEKEGATAVLLKRK